MSCAGTNFGTPPAEVEVTVDWVRDLLQSQHPDLANYRLRRIDAGFDNVLFRLGNHLCVRLPRRQMAAQLIEHEQVWLPRIASRLAAQPAARSPIAIPVPQRIGLPGQGFPWRWSVLPWLPGKAADLGPIERSEAARWGHFLRSLHISAPAGAPKNTYRNCTLAEKAPLLKPRIERLEAITNLVTEPLKDLWQAAINTPIDLPKTWIHGDLHARNVLVNRGKFLGVIDWGDMTAGDAVTDLASVWMLFSDRGAQQQALWAYGEVSAATRQRAKGWAMYIGVSLLDTGLVDNPRHARMGEKILRAIAESAE